MMSCNLLILEEHLEVDTCQGSQRIKYEELILLKQYFSQRKKLKLFKITEASQAENIFLLTKV